MRIYFDDSLDKFTTIIADALGSETLKSGVILRDVIGQLSFFSEERLSKKIKTSTTNKLLKEVSPYCRTDQCISDISDYGTADILIDESIRYILCSNMEIKFIDRRVVGADWLRVPSTQSILPPRYVFSSIKGGVGRSTALAVVAADLASQGKKILAVDLDIEAPGLGSILLTEETLPEFGLLDALVENGLSKLTKTFFADLISPSPLAGNNGRIDVLPVIGRRSLENPADVLSKIARAYSEDIDESGETISILDQISAIIGNFSDPKQYDAILVDARAGLHETTASALLGLGAEVFLFGLDEPQTFHGFSMLLSHMKKYIPRDKLSEWLSKLTIVQGKAPTETELRQSFKFNCQELLTKSGLYTPPPFASNFENEEISDFSEIVWNDDISDLEVLPTENAAQPSIIYIIEDPRYKSFNPTAKRDLIESYFYTSSYQEIINKINGETNLASQENDA